MNHPVFRKATIADIDFIAEAIINAEKSGTTILPLCSIFEISEDELGTVLKNILMEETEGCEFSLSSFIVAEIEGKQAATVAGWIEGKNEMNLPSSIIKANLLNYFLPAFNINAASANSAAIADTLTERTAGTFQIEYVYVKPEYRGNALAVKTIKEHLKGLETGFKAEVQTFGNNITAIRSYEEAGFAITSVHTGKNKEALRFLPDLTKLLMTKTI